MAIRVDQSEPGKLILSLRYSRHWAGACAALAFVTAWYWSIFLYGDRYGVGFKDAQKPVTALLLLIPLSVVPALLRNWTWALAGEKLVFDGTRADVLKNGRIVTDFQGVRSIALSVGRTCSLGLVLDGGREILIDRGGDRQSLEAAGRAAAALLRRSFHIGSV